MSAGGIGRSVRSLRTSSRNVIERTTPISIGIANSPTNHETAGIARTSAIRLYRFVLLRPALGEGSFTNDETEADGLKRASGGRSASCRGSGSELAPQTLHKVSDEA